MPRKIQKLGIEDHFRLPLDDDAFEIVVAALVGNAADLLIGIHVTLQEKLHRLSGIKPDIEITAVGKNENKTVGDAKRKATLHPVHLDFFSRKKR